MSRVESDPWFDFAIQAGAYYPTLIEQLAQARAGETGYARCGMLLVAANADEVPAFAASQQLILHRQAQRAAPTPAELYPVTPEEARVRFPALGLVQGALYYHNAARVDGRLLTAALLRAAQAQGLTVLAANVERLVVAQQQIQGVIVNGDNVAARAVVIAGGAWSPALADQLQLPLPVEPQRGQIIHLTLPGVETGDWPVVNAFHGHYLVAWPGQNGVGRVVAGATRESGAGFVPHTTAAGVIEVLSEALRVAPGLAAAQVQEMRVGLRPLAADGLPVLSKAPTVAGVVIATGHGPNGLQLGPLSGKIAAELALGQPPSAEIRAFAVSRFS
jgi:D-amino-acid dehydrogenase